VTLSFSSYITLYSALWPTPERLAEASKVNTLSSMTLARHGKNRITMHWTANEGAADATGSANCAACVRLRVRADGRVPRRGTLERVHNHQISSGPQRAALCSAVPFPVHICSLYGHTAEFQTVNDNVSELVVHDSRSAKQYAIRRHYVYKVCSEHPAPAATDWIIVPQL
jgi:hypothetical protein